MKDKSFYQYSSFSDTAALIRKYIQSDSVHIEGGWNFYHYRNFFPNTNLVNLSDTVIGSVVYKRIKSEQNFINSGDSLKSEFIGYMRCDKKGTMFTLDKGLSEREGCPLVRVETKSFPQKVWFSVELEFAEKNLSDNEIRVFKTWEKYAKENPVSIK